ncbi:MAG: nucleotide exchange factor GrpE [Bacteroides sp.]|nr:nucleotide exchange factor GrpE [Eubacterium sp.]MCM1418231.1 nucleotide exchange factor GrpE [Roseburia sp.]MCM1463532.1 nucleotide exchange factor GrpE [Bacteroides sp.]
MSKNKQKEKEEKEILKEEDNKAAGDPAESSPAKEEKPKEEPKGEPKGDPKDDPKDQEIARLKDQLLRNVAEYDNYRKRTAKERTELTPEITARIVTEFLPVMDNLERALKTECNDENYKKGVEMICTAFAEALDKLGVERVPTEDFDPSIHQAVQQVESDTLESGKIASVFQNGYRIGTRVLRFAMVAVVS